MGSTKENPDLLYSVARQVAKAWVTVEHADKLRRVQSRPNGAVEWVGSVQKDQRAVEERGGQGSSVPSSGLKLGGSCWKCGKEGQRMADCMAKRKLLLPGGHQ